MENLMDISPGLFIWTLITFGIAVFILGKFAFPIIVKALNDRESGIQNNIDEAKRINKEAKDLFAETEKKIAESYQDAAKIVATGRKNAEEIILKASAEADNIKRQKIEEAIREIEQSKHNAIAQIRSEVSSLIVEATEKILEQKLEGKEHLNLIDNYLNKLN